MAADRTLMKAETAPTIGHGLGATHGDKSWCDLRS